MEIAPFFLQGSSGHIFITLFKNNVAKSKTIYILVPPFLDEMNKSRRMFAKMANILADQGYDALIPDFHGTGDSEGAFVDADWDIWRADFEHLITWCKTQNYLSINFIALRSGALFLSDYLSCHQNTDCEKLILWHPTTNGSSWLTHFLRLQLAANLSTDIDKETTKGLRSRLANGESLEIAGYELSANLANKIQSIKLIDNIPVYVPQVFWIDVVGTQGNDMLLASKRVIDHWKQKSVNVNSETVAGPAFWSAVEFVDVEALLNQTQIYVTENK